MALRIIKSKKRQIQKRQMQIAENLFFKSGVVIEPNCLTEDVIRAMRGAK